MLFCAFPVLFLVLFVAGKAQLRSLEEHQKSTTPEPKFDRSAPDPAGLGQLQPQPDIYFSWPQPLEQASPAPASPGPAC